METIYQKFKGHKVKFVFNDKALSYEYSDSEDSIAFEAQYDEIDVENVIRSTSKNAIWKFIASPFIFLALFAVGKASLNVDSIEKLLAGLVVTLIWVLLAVGCWIKYKRSEVTFTMFDSVRGRLIVVHDGQEDKIINLLKKSVSNYQSMLSHLTSNAVH
ncbi:hypothetical protein [Pseudoalteromonas rubra]|uniref:hypothetical protein n=1 Tax=Pseudoalteromonas rubra TaxID=43658 RepID=UPI000F796B4B|nr:hypothetical protein [Pseudoalteromonas rubra]